MNAHPSRFPAHRPVATRHALRAAGVLAGVLLGRPGDWLQWHPRHQIHLPPLDFLLPGLLQNCPASPVLPLETNTVPLLAQANPVPL